jgi:perosamine synthetase
MTLMRFEEWRPPKIEHGQLTKWNWIVQHPENLILGEKTDIGTFSYINAKNDVVIEDNVQIGSHCAIYSTSTIDNKNGKVILKNGCSIGSHSTIMPGITIGENSIIGAHSFVNKHIPANVIAFGVPAKVIQKRDNISTDHNNITIPLSRPSIGDEDIQGVTSVLNSGILSLGPKTREFEQKFANTIGTRYGIAVNSGTSGLHLVIRALNIKDGDEVITSPFSFIASANCILYERAKPVFVDVEEDTYNIDPYKIEAAITPRTKAILVPHIFGQSANMKKIIEISQKYNLKIIEDACESINATHYNQKVGTFGDAAVFAFYPNKQMTTGEGGIIVTNNESINRYCKSAANQGRSDDMQWLTHDKLGFNYRMDEMSAALGVSQLSKIHQFIQKRQEIAQRYSTLLKDYNKVKTPLIRSENISSWFVYPIRVSAEIRDQVIYVLGSKGIQSKAYFYPCIHLQPFFKKMGLNEGDFPIAEKLSKETLILPFYPNLKIEMINKVISSLKRTIEEI